MKIRRKKTSIKKDIFLDDTVESAYPKYLSKKGKIFTKNGKMLLHCNEKINIKSNKGITIVYLILPFL